MGSLTSLSAPVANRAVQDLQWWFVSLPIPIVFLVTYGWIYETHFPAWDLVGDGEVVWSSAAQVWKTAVVVSGALGVVAALWAGRRAIEHIRMGELLRPLGLLFALLAGASQSAVLVERTPAFRNGRIRAEQVNEIPGYSVGLLFVLALVPLIYLILDRALDR